MAENFTNFAETTLSSGITNVATSIPVTNGANFPTADFSVVIGDGVSGREVVHISSRTGNTLTADQRGWQGTTAIAHSSGKPVTHTVLAHHLVFPRLASDGSAAAPSYSFRSDSGNGMYLSGTDTIGFAVNGNLRATIDNVGITYTGTGSNDTISIGSAFSLAAISFGIGTGSTNTGNMTLYHYYNSLYFPADKLLNLSRPGTTHVGEATGTGIGDKIALYGTATASTRYGFGIQAGQIVAYMASGAGLTVATTAGSGQASAGTGGVYILNSGHVRGLDSGGTATVPTFSWATDNNTGMYRVAEDSIGLSTGGTLRVTLSTAAVTSTLPVRGPVGSVSAPTYSFSTQTNTGIFHSTVFGGEVNIAILGTNMFSVNAAGAFLVGSVNVSDSLTIATDHDVQQMYWMATTP